MIDDILVHGSTQEEHDQRLKAVLECIKKAGVTLNREKCEFSKSSVRFLGQLVDGTGIQPDPDKVKAIQKMKEPTSTTEVRRFLGMANQMSKFTAELAEIAKPLRDLLGKRNAWTSTMSNRHLARALHLPSTTRQRQPLYLQMLRHMALAGFFFRSSQRVSCCPLPTPPEPSPALSNAILK